MMNQYRTLRRLVGTLTLSPTLSFAASVWSDARNDAMGGTGVASSDYRSAAAINPALLSQYPNVDGIELVLPSIGVDITDPDSLKQRFDRVNQTWNDLASHANARRMTGNDLTRFRDALTDIDGRRAHADAAATGMAAYPNPTLPVALVFNSWVALDSSAQVSSQDLATLDAVIDGRLSSPVALNNLTSRGQLLGVSVTEYGLALAHSFTLAGMPFALGVTPKYQRVETYNYNSAVNNYSSADYRHGEYRRADAAANLDVGFSAMPAPGWTLGLVGRNLIARDIDTQIVNGVQHRFRMRPQATAGLAWSGDRLTLAADADLSPNSGFAGQPLRQYAGAGVEYRALSWLQLRTGYRADLRHSDDRRLTAGFGLSPQQRVQFDVTGMVDPSRSHSYGGAVKLSFRF